MSGDVSYSTVDFSQKNQGKRAADKSSTGKEDDVTYATVKFGDAPSRQQQQAASSSTADEISEKSPTGNNYQLPVYRNGGNPTAGKAPPYRWAALVLAGLCALSVAAIIFLSVYISNLTMERKQIQYRHSELEKNYSNISEKYSALDQYCPVTDTSSKERVCKACQVNWVLFNGKCYYFSTDRMNWTSSRDNCTSLGGHLVIIESEAEQEFIQSQVRRIRDFFWIGLSDEVTEGEFLWVDNTPPSTTYWKVNEPDNTLIFEGNQHPNADCAVIDYKVAPLQSWGDTQCSVLVRRVCETISAIPAG
ncbi:C-type lectin domain family 4 member E-like isoform X2 [Acipenser ruthenus]|uniref:C-type lectin domain family 4 member E-like isoform X2 n=1 Tax=Acipenser ruthenus TaxID=7906 RepID=UPI0027403AEC|nr:C-type lectin domain family 4 member E-like isoform X2 [Acipenser ruthenus]